MTSHQHCDLSWINRAVQIIESDYQRSADTHLIKLDNHGFDGIDIYLKDESTHPTGSLKHRLARSLFLYAFVTVGLIAIHQSSSLLQAALQFLRLISRVCLACRLSL